MISLVIIILLVLLIIFTKPKQNQDVSDPETPERKGDVGERDVQKELSYLPAEQYYVLNDVLLPSGKTTTQVDHIVVSLYGIFVIETKNYSGTIYGGRNSEEWSQYLNDEKYVFYNPLLQNKCHVNAVEKLIHIDRKAIIPIVVYTGSAIIKANVDDSVVYLDQLCDKIMLYREPVFSLEQVTQYAKMIDEAFEENEETKRAHVDAVQEKISQRKEIISSGTCPLCGGELLLRHGRYGEFCGCSNYPKCRFTKDL